MGQEVWLARRRLLQRLVLGACLLPLGSAVRSTLAASAPLLSVDAPEAKAVKYVEDARQARAAAAGSSCANCALYQGADGSAQGPCQLFPGKEVKAAGWCSSWAPQL
jgi:hypothetical protein